MNQAKPIPLSVRKRLRQRHVSEVVVLDSIGRRRNRQQAVPQKDEDTRDFWLLIGVAVAASPLVFLVLFTFMLLVAPGPVAR